MIVSDRTQAIGLVAAFTDKEKDQGEELIQPKEKQKVKLATDWYCDWDWDCAKLNLVYLVLLLSLDSQLVII